MTEDNTYKTNKKIRGRAIARLGIYPVQFEALCASLPEDKTLTQYINDLIIEALNETQEH